MHKQDQSISVDEYRPSPRLLEANRLLYELRRTHQAQKKASSSRPDVLACKQLTKLRENVFARKHAAGSRNAGQGGAA